MTEETEAEKQDDTEKNEDPDKLRVWLGPTMSSIAHKLPKNKRREALDALWVAKDEKIAENEERAEVAEEKVESLSAELAEAKHEVEVAEGQIAEVRREVEDARRQLQEAREQVVQPDARTSTAERRYNEAREELTYLRAENAKLSEALPFVLRLASATERRNEIDWQGRLGLQDQIDALGRNVEHLGGLVGLAVQGSDEEVRDAILREMTRLNEAYGRSITAMRERHAQNDRTSKKEVQQIARDVRTAIQTSARASNKEMELVPKEEVEPSVEEARKGEPESRDETEKDRPARERDRGDTER